MINECASDLAVYASDSDAYDDLDAVYVSRDAAGGNASLLELCEVLRLCCVIAAADRISALTRTAGGRTASRCRDDGSDCNRNDLMRERRLMLLALRRIIEGDDVGLTIRPLVIVRLMIMGRADRRCNYRR